MKTLSRIVYGLFAAGALFYGTALLIAPAAMSREAATSFHVSHNLREQGAAMFFIGIMALWCLFNFERRRPVHYALMVFTFLITVIHWFDYAQGGLPFISPVYNTVPFLVLLLLALPLRRATAGRGAVG